MVVCSIPIWGYILNFHFHTLVRQNGVEFRHLDERQEKEYLNTKCSLPTLLYAGVACCMHKKTVIINMLSYLYHKLTIC